MLVILLVNCSTSLLNDYSFTRHEHEANECVAQLLKFNNSRGSGISSDYGLMLSWAREKKPRKKKKKRKKNHQRRTEFKTRISTETPIPAHGSTNLKGLQQGYTILLFIYLCIFFFQVILVFIFYPSPLPPAATGQQNRCNSLVPPFVVFFPPPLSIIHNVIMVGVQVQRFRNEISSSSQFIIPVRHAPFLLRSFATVHSHARDRHPNSRTRVTGQV